MAIIIQSEAPPATSGYVRSAALRVGSSRVLVELVIENASNGLRTCATVLSATKWTWQTSAVVYLHASRVVETAACYVW